MCVCFVNYIVKTWNEIEETEMRNLKSFITETNVTNQEYGTTGTSRFMARVTNVHNAGISLSSLVYRLIYKATSYENEDGLFILIVKGNLFHNMGFKWEW